MFYIKPIKDIEYQKEICSIIGCEYIPGTLAYFAAELADNETIDHIIGICQFAPGENSKIVSLFPAVGCEEDEAMVILCRTVMSFLERSGSKYMTLPFSAGSENLLAKCGLPKKDDCYYVDLEKFYEAPCKYDKE